MKAAAVVIGLIGLFVVLLIVGVKSSNEREQRIAQETANERVQNEALIKQHRVRVGMTTDHVYEVSPRKAP